MSDFLRNVRRWFRRRAERNAAAAWRRAHVGANSHIAPSAQVLGWRQVRIGHHTLVGAETWINVNDRRPDRPVVIIGDNCFLGRRNFINAGELVRFGDYCLTGPDCHFLGADHDFSSPFVPYATSGMVTDGVIEVGSNCWFGSSVIVLKNVRIGFGSVLGAGSVITRDVPPLSVVVGSPARVVQRYDVRAAVWVKTEDYPADGDAQLPTEKEYLANLREKFPSIRGARPALGADFGDI